MHPWRPWILAAALASFAGQAAVVYKWTDDKGVVHYSDQSVPGAQKIFTASSSAGNAAPSAASPAAPVSPAGKKAVTGVLNYAQFTIVSPMPEQTFFGDEVVNIALSLQPGLKDGQSITWHLNGKQLDDQGPTATQFALPTQVRGTYIVAATITDQATGESETSDPVTFYVRQPSELSPQHRRP
jgi:Domain of unknown function (DUF4124)